MALRTGTPWHCQLCHRWHQAMRGRWAQQGDCTAATGCTISRPTKLSPRRDRTAKYKGSPAWYTGRANILCEQGPPATCACTHTHTHTPSVHSATGLGPGLEGRPRGRKTHPIVTGAPEAEATDGLCPAKDANRGRQLYAQQVQRLPGWAAATARSACRSWGCLFCTREAGRR